MDHTIKNIALLPLAAYLLMSCSSNHKVEVAINNASGIDRKGQIVELPADSILGLIGSKYCYVTDADGVEIPSQITADRKLLIPADVAAEESVVYTVFPSDSIHAYDTVVTGRLYPERADDVAWENELVGFRIYGPTTQQKGEKAFGYDLFFKHPTEEPIVEKLYAPETDPKTWEKVDSLRAIDPALADEFIKTFSYHIDHGLGMDCYAVGPTLGAGVAAPWVNDSISFPWCYETAEVIDNGPLRFTVKLDFAPRVVGKDTAVVEHRIISLDKGSHLNNTRVWFDGLSDNIQMVAGFPLRDDSPRIHGMKHIAYADPTQGPDNGKALLGIVFTETPDSVFEAQNHLLARTAPSDTLEYHWGFAWDRTDIRDMQAWNEYLDRYSGIIDNSLDIKITKK